MRVEEFIKELQKYPKDTIIDIPFWNVNSKTPMYCEDFKLVLNGRFLHMEPDL